MAKARTVSWTVGAVFIALSIVVVARWNFGQGTFASESVADVDCTVGVAVTDSANNPGLVSDCEALLLSMATLSASSTQNWSVDVSIDEWDGLTVGGPPMRVTEIRLADSGLTGSLPPELGRLTELEYLAFTGNKLTGSIPRELGDLQNLVTLNLGGNRLSGKIPSDLGRLASLETLYLHHNRLNGSIPSELGALSSLSKLALDDNELTGRIPRQLGNLLNLERLNLQNNFLGGEIPTHLSKLARLEHLRLYNNRLTGEIPAELGMLTGLSYLELDDNLLTGGVPASLVSLPSLTRMYLADNRLTGCIPERLQDVSRSDLSSIDLPFCTQPTVAMGVDAPGIQVRVGSLISVTVWFSEPVSGFTLDDLNVANGTESNLGVVTDGMIYTFDVRPNAVGTVSVDIASDVVVDVESNGNIAARQLVLGIPYDDDNDGAISRAEVITGISDYLLDGLLARDHILDLIGLYLFPPASVMPDLVVETVTVSDSSPEPGRVLTLSAMVRNQGTGPSDTTTLRYYQSNDAAITSTDSQLNTAPLNEMAVSTSTTDETVLIPPSAPGTHYYGACVDTVYRESDETNNCSAGVAVTVTEPDPMTRPVIGPIEGASVGGTLYYLPKASDWDLDPMATGESVAGVVSRHVYDQLFWRDSDYRIHPQMLESWDMSSDGKEYTFRVRAGQTFHNGDPLRMVDIAESHDRFGRVDPLGRELLHISAGNDGKELGEMAFDQTLDEEDNTIVMKFEEPTSMALELLSPIDPLQPSVMHEEVWSIEVGQRMVEAIGTGAYRLTMWRPGESVEFERHVDYVPNTGEPWDFMKGEITQYLDGVLSYYVPEINTRVAAIQTGKVDVVEDLSPDGVSRVDGRQDVTVVPVRDGRYGLHEFNFHHPPFDMTEAGRFARRAVHAASRNDRIMKAVAVDHRFWSECYLQLPCGTQWTSEVAREVQEEGIKTYGGNLTLARETLDQAVRLDPAIRDYPVRLIAASDDLFMKEAGPIMAQTLTDMGFTNVELVSVDRATRNSIIHNPEGAWEISPTWSAFSDGLHPLSPFMAASNLEGSGRWVEPRMTRLREQLLIEVDPAIQQVLFDEMNKLLYEDPARVLHFMFSPARAVRSDVRNLCQDCLFSVFHNVWLDR